MNAEIEVLLLPYDTTRGESLLHRLIKEIATGRWKRFRAAVAFARASGGFEDLLASLERFAGTGGCVELTFGADVFGDSKALTWTQYSNWSNLSVICLPCEYTCTMSPTAHFTRRSISSMPTTGKRLSW